MKIFTKLSFIILGLTPFHVSRSMSLLLLILLTLNACNSVPSDKEIQSSIDKNVEFYKNSGSLDEVSDSIKSVFVGKTKISGKEIKVYYSHDGTVYDDIKLICLDNGKWIMQKGKYRKWEMK